MLVQATGLPEDTCTAALVDAEGDAKVALVALLAPASAAEARQALEAANGVVRDALRPSHGR